MIPVLLLLPAGAAAGNSPVELPCAYVPGEMIVYRYTHMTLLGPVSISGQTKQWDVSVEVESWDGRTVVLRALHGPEQLVEAAPDDTIGPALLAAAARHAEHHPRITRFAVDHATAERTILNPDEVLEAANARLDAVWRDLEATGRSATELQPAADEQGLTPEAVLPSIHDDLSMLVRHRCRSVSPRSSFSDVLRHPRGGEPLTTTGTIKIKEKRRVVEVDTDESVGELTAAQLEPFRALLPSGRSDLPDSFEVRMGRVREVAVHRTSSWPTSGWTLLITNMMIDGDSVYTTVDNVQIVAIDHRVPGSG